MRLSEIYNKINQLEIKNHTLFIRNSDIYNIDNFKLLIKYIEENKLGFYQNEVNEIKSSEIYSTTQNSVFVSEDKRNKIYFLAKYITDSIQSLQIVLKNIVPKTTENDLLIKLPEKNDFDKMINDITEIKKHISMIVYDEDVNTSLKLNNWEYGSFWLNITLGSIFAVQLMGSIIWASAFISTNINKHREQELYIERLKLNNDMLKDMKEAHSKLLNELLDNEINNIKTKHFKDKDNNQRDKKIRNTILSFSEIISRGGEFQPSLVSPEEIKKSYPDFLKLENIQSQIKQITEKPKSQEN